MRLENNPAFASKGNDEVDDSRNSAPKNQGDVKEKAAKIGGIVMIVAIVASFLILALLDINFGQWLADITWNFYQIYGDVGIYIAVFVISTFGNFTVIFPVPYTIALIVISALLPVNPFLLGLPAGIGAAIGETSAWVVGRGTQSFLEDSPRVNRMKDWIDNGWASALVFIFAATPLPDDAFLIVLGFASYPLWKALIWCFLGKYVMCFTVSGITVWARDTAWGKSALGLFGVDIDSVKDPTIKSSGNIWQSTIMWIVTLVGTILIVYVDWGKVGEKLRKKGSDAADKLNEASGVAQFLRLSSLRFPPRF
ncbi:MAG: hypothetical protein ACTSU5_09690 [Promethearchaeota archaeon]